MPPGNSKAVGWDLVGAQFWESGRRSAKPSEREIEMFVQDITGGVSTVVIGATTKGLVDTLLGVGADVTVLDFSAGVLDALAKALGPGACKMRLLDITVPLPEDLRETQSYVLSDRLINRFVEQEAVAGLAGMLGLLEAGGRMRTSVKLGLYPMDERMIEKGRSWGVLSRFYNEANRVMDFGAAGDVLTQALLPHGTIHRDVLLKWYEARGREQRFDDDDVIRLIAGCKVGGRRLELTSNSVLPDAPDVRIYEARARETAD